MGVTIAVTIIGTLASMLVTCLISYAISIKEMRYRNVIAFICNFTSIFSAGLVPWYVVCVNWYNLSNTLWALILPSMFSVWNMFLMRTYFNNISQSLYDAAKIDGAGHWTIFFRIAMPLSKTAILTVGLMYLLSYWNNWWNALMFISDRDLYPLQYYLYSIVSNVNAISSGCIPSGAAATIRLPSETVKMAVTIITIGPIIFVYPFIQRYINATGGEVLCIPYSAPNPEGALRFLAWLWANQDNYMFCLYGEQGKDWELNDEGRLVLLSNIARGDGYFYEWMFRNFNYKVFPEESPGTSEGESELSPVDCSQAFPGCFASGLAASPPGQKHNGTKPDFRVLSRTSGNHADLISQAISAIEVQEMKSPGAGARGPHRPSPRRYPFKRD